MKRLTHLETLRINPEKALFFSYGKKSMQGFQGDTVATALFANGERIFSRSHKYHRPRGLYSLDGESSNTLMQINGIPNEAAEIILLDKGMTVKPQNVLGSPDLDLLGVLDKLHWAMPAGFYYRRMHKPYIFWPLFLKQIRKAAGIGEITPDFSMPGDFSELYPSADVCIVGAGPAGMSAALAAAEYGLRIILLEAQPWLGGFFDYRPGAYTPEIPLYKHSRSLAAQVTATPNIRVFRHTRMTAVYPNNLITACQTGASDDPFNYRYIEIQAKSVVIATGCIERPLLFENNDFPGIMQISCAQRLARTYGLLPGKRAVFSVGHDLGLEAAIDLADLGVTVSAVADHRRDGQNPSLVEGLAERNIPFLRGWVVSKANGKKRVKKASICTTEATLWKEFDCDLLVASAGMTPLTGALSTAGVKMQYDLHTGFYLPSRLPPKIHTAGRLLGFQASRAIEISGELAGISAAGDCGQDVTARVAQLREMMSHQAGPDRGAKLVQAPGNAKRAFVCFDEDVTIDNIDQARSMGFETPELAKRFTAAGTGPSQSGIPGHNLPLVMEQLQAGSNASRRPTTVRSPLTPALIAAYAGSNHDMIKRTPLDDQQQAAGGIFRRIGAWQRARYFSEDQNCREEIEAVRNNVGLIDVSTLGKFRLFGPDATKVLQRVYIGNMSDIRDDKVKYAAMCNEDGNLLDDGIVVQRRSNDYYLTTSTGRAAGTAEWIGYHTRYDNWDYHLVNLTDALGAINLAGPKSRQVLAKIADMDVSNYSFPYLGYRELMLKQKIPVRVLRLGFVGELSFEIHMPASYAPAVWDILVEAGQEYGIRPFGLEAQNCLRLEKGHIIIGQESEIRTTLHDLGLGFLWYRHKPEAKTVGSTALKHTETQSGRLKLVGFKMVYSNPAPKDGSIIVDSKIRGHVCTARNSAALEASIGLALVEEALTPKGTRLEIMEDGGGDRRLYAEVVSLPFYDPEGKRVRM